MEGREQNGWQNNDGENEAGPGTGWETWEATPRDGPAVFVVDAVAFDHDVVRGRWIDPHGDVEVVVSQLVELLGREPVEGAWAVVDQVGLGPIMVPETLAVEELGPTVQELAAAVGAST